MTDSCEVFMRSCLFVMIISLMKCSGKVLNVLNVSHETDFFFFMNIFVRALIVIYNW